MKEFNQYSFIEHAIQRYHDLNSTSKRESVPSDDEIRDKLNHLERAEFVDYLFDYLKTEYFFELESKIKSFEEHINRLEAQIEYLEHRLNIDRD